jgi:hypothetical protein
MDTHYLANSVLTKSVWINPKGAGPITDYDAHSIVFDQTGTKAFLFSDEPRDLSISGPRRRVPQETPSHEETLVLSAVYETVYETVSGFQTRDRRRRRDRDEPDFRMPMELPPFVRSGDDGELIKALADLFSSYLGVSWLVEVNH